MTYYRDYMTRVLALVEGILPFYVFILMAFYFVPNIILIPTITSVVYVVAALIGQNRMKFLSSKWPLLALSAMYITYYLVKIVGNVSMEVINMFIVYSAIFILSIMAMDS